MNPSEISPQIVNNVIPKAMPFFCRSPPKGLLTGEIWTTLQRVIPGSRNYSFGNFGRVLDKLPTRETWFCFYQPRLGHTAYLYEYNVPINNTVYIQQVRLEPGKGAWKVARVQMSYYICPAGVTCFKLSIPFSLSGTVTTGHNTRDCPPGPFPRSSSHR